MPSRKMRSLFWSKSTLHKAGIWKEAGECSLDDLRIDFTELESKFSVDETAVKKRSLLERSGSAGKEKKKQLVSLLDSKRAQMIEISFGTFKVTPEELTGLAIQLDPDTLTLDRTEVVLEALLPTDTEAKTVRTFKGHPSELVIADRVVAALSSVPRLDKRMACHRSVFTWHATVDQMSARLSVVCDSCSDITSATIKQHFAHLLAVVLATGNYINAGSSRVTGAIELESLLKLASVKSEARGGCESLLHFIVKEVRAKLPAALQGLVGLQAVHLAAGINFSQLRNDILRAQDELNKVQSEVELGDRIKGMAVSQCEILFESLFPRLRLLVMLGLSLVLLKRNPVDVLVWIE
jgi:hypothetical protein